MVELANLLCVKAKMNALSLVIPRFFHYSSGNIVFSLSFRRGLDPQILQAGCVFSQKTTRSDWQKGDDG